MRYHTAIIGGGISGLACAAALGPSAVVLEKDDTPGGLCRSVRQDGFTFDYTGHFLHLHTGEGERFVRRALRGNLREVRRAAWIHSCGADTRYPFQANLRGLPPRVVRECIEGYLKAYYDGRTRRADRSFRELVLNTFGQGFARHFFIPYNTKLLTVPLDTVTPEWIGPFIPRPEPADVMRGAVADNGKTFGYNASFLYPARGGIGAFMEQLAGRVRNLRLGSAVSSVHAGGRSLVAGGERIGYDALVSTMPLPELVGLIEDAPAQVRRAARELAWNAVLCLNMGFSRPVKPGFHWTYFPEKNYNFYRVGSYSNISPSSAPAGRGSLYVEIACRPERRMDYAAAYRRALRGLRESGIIDRRARVTALNIIFMPYGYVIFDRRREAALRVIRRFMERHRIFTLGRYGAWEYSYMEESLLQARGIARKLAA